MALTRTHKWIIASVVGLVLAIGLAGAGWFGWQAYRWTAPGPSLNDTVVFIEEGSSLTKAARTLQDAGVIEDSRAFLRLVRWFGSEKPIKAGEYAMPHGVSPAEALRLLQEGVVLLRQVTVVEGMSAIQVFERLMSEPMLAGEVAVPDEGSVLPETYSFVRGETRQAVLGRMQAAMKKTLNELWEARDEGLPFQNPL
ncbi:MAG TPA: endolytic transglycosylase MltG, partial [Pedomonas sp.]|uniref:endolytic transglycosylase MltG n=1 Tax=Pedomonas sp. TaxID=2976421 RepID=UPI002F3FF4BE